MEYETEEQQLEAIKKWWKENSSLVIIGVSIGVSSIFGWQYYQADKVNHAQHASVLYERVLIHSADSAKMSDQLASVNQLEAEFKDTPYASLSAMIIARQQVQSGENAKAEKHYRWVIENSNQKELQYLAKIRLSRVLLATAQYEKTLALLNEEYPDSFKGMVLELKGDAFAVQEKKAEARITYIKARSYLKGPNRWLQLKIDDIAETASATKTPVVKSASTKPAA